MGRISAGINRQIVQRSSEIMWTGILDTHPCDYENFTTVMKCDLEQYWLLSVLACL
jgi:hypothetical protein